MNKNRNSAKIGLKKEHQAIARLISNNLKNRVHGHSFFVIERFWTVSMDTFLIMKNEQKQK